MVYDRNNEDPHFQEISGERNKVSASNSQHDIFLLLDEVPCNSRRKSGDWSGLKQNEVHLMMALKPINDFLHGAGKQIELHFSDDMKNLQLNRVYRCTQSILSFYTTVVKRLNAESSTIIKFNSFSATSYEPGHEIFGDLPEILLLSQCYQCLSRCDHPLTHNFMEFTKKTKILALLKRLQTKLKPMRITVIFDIGFEKQECIGWLIEELEAKGMTEAFEVKVIEECRGMEYPAVVIISHGDGYSGGLKRSSLIIDTWTRVTSSMSVIHVDNGFDDAFKSGLEDAMKDNVAKKAEEQDMRLREFHRKYDNDQHGKEKFFSQAL